jgi:rod shape-determining protein MreD
VVLATEFLRGREALTRDLPFPLEIAMIGGVLAAATLAEALVLSVFLVPKAGLAVALSHMLITLVAYPFVVAALWLGLGLRRAATGEVDQLGRRL